MKRNILRWFGNLERKNSKVYMNEIEGPNREQRWKDTAKDCMHEIGANRWRRFEQARREYMDSGGSALAIHLGDICGDNETSEFLNRIYR